MMSVRYFNSCCLLRDHGSTIWSTFRVPRWAIPRFISTDWPIESRSYSPTPGPVSGISARAPRVHPRRFVLNVETAHQRQPHRESALEAPLDRVIAEAGVRRELAIAVARPVGSPGPDQRPREEARRPR